MIFKPQHGRPFPWPCKECGRTTYPRLEEAKAASEVCHARPVGQLTCMALAVVCGNQDAVDAHRPDPLLTTEQIS